MSSLLLRCCCAAAAAAAWACLTDRCLSLSPPFRCGGFANRECAGEAKEAVESKVCADGTPMDEEAAALEAARLESDRANMADAIRIAAELPGSSTEVTTNNDNQCGKQREGKEMTLRCPGHNVVEAVEFASYGTPRGNCIGIGGDNTFETDSDCHSSASADYVKRKCMGLNWCEIAATNQDFSDPCYGKGKQLAVAVKCSTGRDQPSLPAGINPDPAKRPPLPPLPRSVDPPTRSPSAATDTPLQSFHLRQVRTADMQCGWSRVTMRQLQHRADLLKGDVPFALLDGTKGWPAMTNWSLDYFGQVPTSSSASSASPWHNHPWHNHPSTLGRPTPGCPRTDASGCLLLPRPLPL